MSTVAHDQFSYFWMRILTVTGRVLFAAVFLHSAFIEFVNFGVVEGPEAEALRPKYDQITARVAPLLGYIAPEIEIKHVIAATIAVRVIGGLLFIYGSSVGAYLLMLYLAFITPIVYDFYKYNTEDPKFFRVFVMFAQNMALFGGLLFFIGLNNQMAKKRSNKNRRSSKSKKGT
ncbi:hypothetical protein J5N97_024197 [Dioscorea zingiberensis]|uniref:Uncharacterized protein n=1 Tax=Dioscorea zingiberensis TaxID=325984 RepID=A0A9D5C6H9_9LILI|nr:hypothetical protein J5N97_024197 [Dioscorea zingiberensis]